MSSVKVPDKASKVGTGRKPPNAGKGRPKGTPNKTTANVKQALTLAFQGIGGVPKLEEWAKENRTEFYKLWSRMLPVEVGGPDGGPVPVQIWQIGDRTIRF